MHKELRKQRYRPETDVRSVTNCRDYADNWLNSVKHEDLAKIFSSQFGLCGRWESMSYAWNCVVLDSI